MDMLLSPRCRFEVVVAGPARVAPESRACRRPSPPSVTPAAPPSRSPAAWPAAPWLRWLLVPSGPVADASAPPFTSRTTRVSCPSPNLTKQTVEVACGHAPTAGVAFRVHLKSVELSCLMPEPQPTLLSRYQGSLLGLAIGDALGAPVEFCPPGRFLPITGFSAGGKFHTAPGEWTDDTAMALCLGESLLRCGVFDLADQATTYARWIAQGHNSTRPHAFGVGRTVLAGLSRFHRTGDPRSGAADRKAQGNGSLMRLAPVPLAFRKNPTRAVALAGESSLVTHGSEACIDGCKALCACILMALQGSQVSEIVSLDAVTALTGPLCPEITAVFAELWTVAPVAEGHAPRSLHAALWALAHHPDFRTGALAVVNLGDDADTVGAIYGQIAGAHYGLGGVPPEWVEGVFKTAEIRAMAGQLFELSGGEV